MSPIIIYHLLMIVLLFVFIIIIIIIVVVVVVAVVVFVIFTRNTKDKNLITNINYYQVLNFCFLVKIQHSLCILMIIFWGASTSVLGRTGRIIA